MFGDALLESSPTVRKNKRWPMATAFTIEMIVASVVIIVPLLSTGVIPLSVRSPIFTPDKPVIVRTTTAEGTTRSGAAGPATSAPKPAVVLISNNPNAIHFGDSREVTTDPTLAQPYNPGNGSHLPENLIGNNAGPANVKPGPLRIVFSQFSEAQLLNRVEPVYPRIATLSGIQGQVKLHAIIARDGSVQSLNVISGHPLLAAAALDAVRQWRYRPYLLNGEPVEVETFITVNFRRDQH